MKKRISRKNVSAENLNDQAEHLEQEGRMILPGIQALFGFQFVAVFNQRFADLPYGFQILHWAALGLTALSTIFMMAPAAYHRQAEPGVISKRFVRLSSRWLMWSLIPLCLGIAADFYIIGWLITGRSVISGSASFAILVAFFAVWFAYPLSQKRPSPR